MLTYILQKYRTHICNAFGTVFGVSFSALDRKWSTSKIALEVHICKDGQSCKVSDQSLLSNAAEKSTKNKIANILAGKLEKGKVEGEGWLLQNL